MVPTIVSSLFHRGSIMSIALVRNLHSRLIFGRRTQILAEVIADMIPANASVLDVGCGDGSVAASVQQRRPDVTIEGIDTLVRQKTKIPVSAFDGQTLPFGDRSFDVVSFIDVLHHAEDANLLMAEARRVSCRWIIIKDHYSETHFDFAALAAMDWVGNAAYGVSLPYRYWSRSTWNAEFEKLGFVVNRLQESISLYPFPLNIVFGRGLHFVALIQSAVAP